MDKVNITCNACATRDYCEKCHSDLDPICQDFLPNYISNGQGLVIPKYKSLMIIGNVVILNNRKFNHWEKFWWKFFLGIVIEDINNEQ